MGDPDNSVDSTSHNDVNVQDREGVMLTDSGDNYQATGLSRAMQGVHKLSRPFHFQGLSLWQFALGQSEALYYVVINTGALFAKVRLFKDHP
jgi:hypothetical protein